MRAQYEGESSRSTFTRGVQHQEDFLKQRLGTPLHDHVLACHQDKKLDITDFTMERTGVYKRPTERLVAEGTFIQDLVEQQIAGNKSGEKVVIMNSKTN